LFSWQIWLLLFSVKCILIKYLQWLADYLPSYGKAVEDEIPIMCYVH